MLFHSRDYFLARNHNNMFFQSNVCLSCTFSDLFVQYQLCYCMDYLPVVVFLDLFLFLRFKILYAYNNTSEWTDMEFC